MNDFELISGLRDGGEIGAMVGSVPDMPASVSSADYTYHTIPDLTIRRGEKAIVNLYTGVVRYSHLYRWDVPSNIQHVLVMLNESDTAWTTGPCLAVRGRRPLSEDLLKYTPKGGRSELPIGTAININHRQSEKETDRRAQAYEKIIEYAHDDVPKRSEFWDLVTLEGTLQIKNYEPHPANVIVTQNVKGKPLSASHDGETRLDTGDLQLMARSGSVRWEVEVSPGEATTLTYTYERYVKSP
jgi:hypothetical protein